MALLLVVAAACGSDDSDDSSSDSGSSSTEATDTTEAASGDPFAPQPLEERESITISATVAIEPFAPAFLADYFGEFEKENLDVEIQTLAPNDAYLALNQGDIKMHMDGINAAFLNNKQAGNDLVWVANIHHLPAESREGFWVRNDLLNEDGEVDPDQIDGMSIALGTGGIGVAGALPVSVWLEEQGKSLADIEPVSLGGADGLVALENGSVDAAYVISPFWLQLQDGDCCTFIETWPGGFSASVYTMSEAFINDQPEVAHALFRAIGRTIETYLQGDYHADPEVLAALSEVLGAPEDSIAAGPPLVFDPDFGFDTEVVEQIQEMWIAAGGILSYEDPLPEDELVDQSVIQAVLAGT